MDRLIILTPERLLKARTPRGGYNAKQLKYLGLDWPVDKGWKDSLLGTKITLGVFINFVKAGRNTIYINEIESNLANLLPPLVIPTPTKIESNGFQKIKLSKKDRKLEKRLIKNAAKRNERAEKVIGLGIAESIRVIEESGLSKLHASQQSLIKSIKQKDHELINTDEAHSLFSMMRALGITLARKPDGQVYPRKFQKITQIRRDQRLYIIRAQGTKEVKIGISKVLNKRKSGLQSGNAKKLTVSMEYITICHAKKVETMLHDLFKTRRLEGEWFLGVSDDEIEEAVGSMGSKVI